MGREQTATAIGPVRAGSPRAAVILLVHADYAQRYLERCYASLQRQTAARDQFGVFIVANGVSPESLAFIARVAPAARCLTQPTNRGWSGGNNAAITRALEEGYAYLVLLNVDTMVEPDWLAQLLEAAATRPEVHILQSTLLLDGTGRINSLGNRIQYLGYGYCNGYGQLDRGPARAAPIDYASGAAMLVKREVFERIGMLREEYVLYYDDMEFCWRARLAGFHIGLAERSRCHHAYVFTARLPWLYYLQRNRLWTLLSLTRLRTLLLLAPCLVLSELIVWGYFLAQGWGSTVWRLARDFGRPSTWRLIRRWRGQIRAVRVRRDADIVTGFAGPIVFAEIDLPFLRHVANPLLCLYWAIIRRLICW